MMFTTKHGMLIAGFGLLTLTTLTTTPAFAQSSVGTYSGCKKLGASEKACLECVGGGNFYQVKSKTCGLAPGMTAAKPEVASKPPARPTSMPSTAGRYVTIPAGSFRIGRQEGELGSDAETFNATVTISHPFLMKTTEVTQAEWFFVMGDPGTNYDSACGGDCAVGGVSWRRALDYLNALSKRESLEPCYDFTEKEVTWTKGVACTGYRLPTDAEWEYAARGKTTTARYGEPDSVGWSADNSGKKRHPVGQKAANAYGLYDMLGSQWEWTWDLEDINQPFAGKMTDPITGGLTASIEFCAPGRCSSRRVRGGSFRDHVADMRATTRYQFLWNSGGASFGFRPVRTVGEKK